MGVEVKATVARWCRRGTRVVGVSTASVGSADGPERGVAMAGRGR